MASTTTEWINIRLLKCSIPVIPVWCIQWSLKWRIKDKKKQPLWSRLSMSTADWVTPWEKPCTSPPTPLPPPPSGQAISHELWCCYHHRQLCGWKAGLCLTHIAYECVLEQQVRDHRVWSAVWFRSEQVMYRKCRSAQSSMLVFDHGTFLIFLCHLPKTGSECIWFNNARI